MKKYIYTLLLLGLTSCTDFLNVPPSKNSQMEIETAEQLNALLGNYVNFFKENNMSSCWATDDCGLTADLYKKETTCFQISNVFHTLWDIDGVANDSYEILWTSEYQKIFTANLVLDNLSKVSGDKTLKEKLRREAHFIRAVSYWQLVNTYAMLDTPENQKEPGVTLKQTTSFEEKTGRATIEETNKLIEADLKIALEETDPIIQNGKFRPWRISKTGAKAFAARYYLQKGNYDQALTYAQGALAEYSTLIDYNTEFRYYERQIPIRVGNVTKYLDFPFTLYSTDNDILTWKEFYYSRVLTTDNGWFIPSQSLLDLYDHDHDLRYRYLMVEDFSFYKNAKQVSYPGYTFFGSNSKPSGPTVPEMILIKAECMIRKGQWSEGMQVLETLRKKRIEQSAYTPLAANNQNDALRHVLEERRREMPFSHRWFDARRLNQNNDPSDDVEFVKQFYSYNISTVFVEQATKEYKLTKNSRRWASPIPYKETVSSQKEIVQNQY